MQVLQFNAQTIFQLTKQIITNYLNT